VTNPQLFLRLDNLEAKYKTDGRLKELLVKASLNRIKKDEVAELQQIVKRIDVQSSLLGFVFNSLLLNLNVSDRDIVQLSNVSNQRISKITDESISLLEEKKTGPEALQNVLASSLIRQSFTKGQSFLADKKNVGFKTWVRTGSSKTGEIRPHSNLERKTIARDDLFTLPSGSRVIAPHDWTASNPKREWVNCRHACLYHPFSSTEEFRAFIRSKKV